jgi:hypothetical protein
VGRGKAGDFVTTRVQKKRPPHGRALMPLGEGVIGQLSRFQNASTRMQFRSISLFFRLTAFWTGGRIVPWDKRNDRHAPIAGLFCF